MPKHYCQVIDRKTGVTLKEYPDVVAIDWYYARHKVSSDYAKTNTTGDWYVDSIELDDDKKHE